MHYYYSYDQFLKNYFGKKVYKICLNGGFTCPNRDGTLSTKGCIFCSEGGSGDFSTPAHLSITQQIDLGRQQTAKKYSGDNYIAYFQAFTNTYAPVYRLSKLYTEALEHPQVIALSIATRPDCLPPDVLSLLAELNRKKPVFVELGLQTIHESTAAFINRGYTTECFDRAVRQCADAGLRTTAHLILGLPHETPAMQLASIGHLNQLPVNGVKLSMLHILKGTPLADYYAKHPFPLFTLEDYTDFVVTCLAHLRPDIVVERLTGDGPKDLLIAPLWSRQKRLVLNTIMHKLKKTQTRQGKLYQQGESL